jgi:glycosyltransferase involved in cell wall biosynthesis
MFRLAFRSPKDFPRVLHLPTTVGGNPQAISRQFSSQGIYSHSWAVSQNYFSFVADYYISSKEDSRLMLEAKRFLALRYVFLYDVIFFNYGQTLFPQLPRRHSFADQGILHALAYQSYRTYLYCMQKIEIFLLLSLGRKLFVQYQGDDARQGDYSLANFRISIASQVNKSYYNKYSDALKRSQIKLFSKICEKVYALNPDLLHVLPHRAEFLPYSSVDLAEIAPSFTQLEDRPLRICHAPSHRAVKGTQIILDAFDRLKSEGYCFEVILVEKKPNSQAINLYRHADILVDQLFAGWYGALALEMMALGKPVVAYIRDEDMKHVPVEMYSDMPILNAEPGSVYDVIRRILEMPRIDLYRIALKSRLYVERWHDPAAICGRLYSDILSSFSR